MTVVAFSAVRIFHPTRSITNGTGRHLFKFFTCVKNFIVRFFFKKIKSLVAKTYIKHYIKLTGISLKEIRKWDLAIYAARLREPVPLEYDNLLKMITKILKNYK